MTEPVQTIEPFIVVWRQTEGSALSTFTAGGRNPRVFSDPEKLENSIAAAPYVEEDELVELVKSRDEFDKKRVPITLAIRALGWSVDALTDQGE